MKKAYVEKRTQKSKGSSRGKFGGPDVYWAVQIVPVGQIPLKSLNRKIAEKRGIEIIYCGQGYSRRTGPTSSYHAAKKEAEKLALAINLANQ